MLAYSRMKSIGVQKQNESLRVASGVLEDELYAMECEVAVNWATMTVESVQARMKRFTTERCPLAEPVFVRAEGWKLDRDIDGRIKKELGREGCRHMAILLVDCLHAIARAELARELREAMETDPELDRKGFLEAFSNRNPEAAEYLRVQ